MCTIDCKRVGRGLFSCTPFVSLVFFVVKNKGIHHKGHEEHKDSQRQNRQFDPV